MTRIHHLISLLTGDDKHHAASHSTLEVLRVLYEHVLDVSPDRIEDPRRDRFYLSKGHGPMAYYAVLADQGYIPEQWLAGWAAYDSPLGHHPDRTLIPGVEISSGSLGHGLPLAVGTALGLRAQSIPARVVVLVGDAELDEGSNHEAIALAGALNLDNLTTVVIDNASTSYRVPEGIERRFATERWSARRVDGRDRDALRRAFAAPRTGLPQVVVADVSREVAA